ncbi:MAG: hypothetical protein N2053_01950 [Chitinispirillaceae bacterium]|nr:hypothetical protein [Chitinispirillaceae bacterium]
MVLLLLFSQCKNSNTLEIPYEPEVVFTGYINGVYDSLAGNLFWPNTCRLIGDTIRIYCYSTYFSDANKIRNGDLFRLDIYPPDSTNLFSKRNALFHFARYHDRNESYTINIKDTIDNTIRLEAKIIEISRSTGDSLILQDIYIATPPVKEGKYLEIKKGYLRGVVN